MKRKQILLIILLTFGRLRIIMALERRRNYV